MRNIFILMFFIFFTSLCSGQVLKKIRLDYLHGLTMEIDGAGEFFTYDSVPLDMTHLLMNTNLSYGAMIINSKLIQFKLISKRQMPNAKRIDVFKGGMYKLIITSERKVIEHQKFISEGIMEIIAGNLKRIIKIRSEGTDPWMPN